MIKNSAKSDLNERYERLREIWIGEIESIVEKAMGETRDLMFEDSINEYLLKRSGIFFFVSKFNQVFCQEITSILAELQKLENPLNSEKVDPKKAL